MGDSFIVACVQHCAGNNVDANLDVLTRLIARAASEGANFVCLPEACDFLSGAEGAVQAYAQTAQDHKALAALVSCANSHGIWLLIGSLTIKDEAGAVVNRSLLVSPTGKVQAQYDKIHMFDADVPGQKASRESRLYRAGNQATLTDLPWGRLGLSICYDLRFPHLYRRLAQNGATLLSVPAAFTRPTGEAHWHVLLRSRAIENGCFIFAPAQWGNHYGERYSYGHSLIVDPWGRILDEAKDGNGIAIATIDMSLVQKSRSAIASLRHDREFNVIKQN